MPSAVLKKISDKSGKSMKELEAFWKEAKAAAKEKGFGEGEDRFWAYVVGIVKKRAGIGDKDLSEMAQAIMKDQKYQMAKVVEFVGNERKVMLVWEKAKAQAEQMVKANRISEDDMYTYAMDILKLGVGYKLVSGVQQVEEAKKDDVLAYHKLKNGKEIAMLKKIAVLRVDKFSAYYLGDDGNVWFKKFRDKGYVNNGDYKKFVNDAKSGKINVDLVESLDEGTQLVDTDADFDDAKVGEVITKKEWEELKKSGYDPKKLNKKDMQLLVQKVEQGKKKEGKKFSIASVVGNLALGFVGGFAAVRAIDSFFTMMRTK